MQSPCYDKFTVKNAATSAARKQTEDPLGNSLPSLASFQHGDDESSIESELSSEEEEEELENEHRGMLIEFKMITIVRDDYRRPSTIASSPFVISKQKRAAGASSSHDLGDESEDDEWSVSLGGADYDVSESRSKIPGHLYRLQRRGSMTSESESSFESLELVVRTSSIHGDTTTDAASPIGRNVKSPRRSQRICNIQCRRKGDSFDGASVDSLKLARNTYRSPCEDSCRRNSISSAAA